MIRAVISIVWPGSCGGGPLFARLVLPMLAVMPRIPGQDPPEMLFAVDQQVVEALAP